MGNGSDRPGGADDREGDIVERLPPDEAFELLSNDLRLDILWTLFDADEPLAFSALRDAVGVRDSGQFNYHLDKLLGTFAERTPDGYELTAAGTHVVGAILAGEYTKIVESDPIDVGAACPRCEGALAGVFEEGYGRIRCGVCDRDLLSLTVPPGAFEDYPRAEWPLVAERWTRREFETVKAGFCSVCHGPVESHVETGAIPLFEDFDAGVRYSCDRCGQSVFANVEASVVSHPAVVAFHYDHGVDIEATPIWELEWAVRACAGVVSEAPLRVEVPVELDGDRLVLLLDEHAAVIETRRA